jgi:hypothetical protein
MGLFGYHLTAKGLKMQTSLRSAGPTKIITDLLGRRCRHHDDRTRNRSRYDGDAFWLRACLTIFFLKKRMQTLSEFGHAKGLVNNRELVCRPVTREHVSHVARRK